MRALLQPHLGSGVDARTQRQHLLDPWPARIDENAGTDGRARAAYGIFARHPPDPALQADLGRAGAGVDFGATLGSVLGGEDDQPGVVNEAVRIFKALLIAAGHERLADRLAARIAP